MNEEILKLQEKEANEGALNTQEHGYLLSLIRAYHRNLRMQETMWQQKSRVMWLKAGDAKTKFFHRSTILRKRKNRINTLQNEMGDLVDQEEGIKDLLKVLLN